MSELSRREAIGRLAMAFAGAGALDRLAATDVHALVAQRPGQVYVPQALTTGQYRALERLTDLIIPVDGSRPGALQAGVPAWIDTLLTVNAELKSRVIGGLAWLDTTMRARHGHDFVAVTPAQQTMLLDQIAFQKNRSVELNPGIDFFILARRMTVDGFYTSPLGMRDIYQGNQARQTFTVPQEAMDYVISRSPLK
jgi:hypothetical protein